jgi:hypothetical protein
MQKKSRGRQAKASATVRLHVGEQLLHDDPMLKSFTDMNSDIAICTAGVQNLD